MNTILSREARQVSRRSGVLRTEPIFVVSALRAPAAIADLLLFVALPLIVGCLIVQVVL